MEAEKGTKKVTKVKANIKETGLSLGKVPPQAFDLEEAVLGALMLEKDALTEVVDVLRPESFYHERHQYIYKAILSLFTKSEPVDLLTVTNKYVKMVS